jgi:site-specific recombinase XerC
MINSLLLRARKPRNEHCIKPGATQSPSLAATQPDNLRRLQIEAALAAMHDAGQSHRSIHQAAVVLNTALAWAREQHMTRATPVTGCRLPNGTILTATRHR